MIGGIEVNYLVILVSAIISFIIGALWYSLLFGKSWTKLMGFSAKDIEKTKKKSMAKTYLIGFVAQLILAYVLANFVIYADAKTFSEGIQVGFFIWLGFVATISLGMILWEKKSIKLYLINTGYWLISLIIQSMILSVWQ